ncbi:MAG: ABC transporter substrate-binding protein [Chloroflexi bacterium]|nr:ABC transporter substrate-binding protein [Chloroflexota bacterium]
MTDAKTLEKYLNYVREATLSRRNFMRNTAGLATMAALAACAPAAPAGQAPAAAGATPAAGATVAAGAPKTGGTLVFAAESIGESLEPGLWNGFGISNVIDNVGAYLTRPNSSGQWTDPAEASLAESWTISEDGKTYTFKIRKGVKFHDGADLDADAIVRSLTRQVNKDDASFVDGLYMHVNYTFNRKSITAPDKETVVIELERPDAAYLYRLFHPSAIIISPKALDEYKKEINTNLISCGPFKIDKFTPGAEVTLVAFDDFWEGRPYIDKIVVRGYPDEGAMLAAIEAGEVNFAPYPPASAVQRLKESQEMKVMAGPPLINLFLGCCTLNEPTNNHDVRLAINYAINRDNVIKAVLYGLGELPASFVGPTEFGFDPAGRDISKQDIAKAKDHVAKSGLPTPIKFSLTYENNRFWPQMAELVKSDLEAVGFAVTLDAQDSGSYWGKVNDGKSQLNMNQRSLWVPDPDNKVTLLESHNASAQGETGIAKAMPEYSKKMDELLAAGVSELDKTKRAEIYKQIQELILEEMPYVMLAYYTKPVIMAANINDLPIGGASTERIFLQKVWMS